MSMGKENVFKGPSEKEVFEQLIDCYRMRVEDEYVFCGDAGGIYSGEDPTDEFMEFLDQAESRKGLLPQWWIEKSDIQEHYSNLLMPMSLRVLGEKIYGKGFM
ncbi:hypothetical protein BJ878DRAFT_484137 [Calycina marina]|uniref:Uncharacterized protein n=1 Tax=Calycina marina TaxID=1763456 RepID=A0A9P8CAN7_9HELO|nr:hypothetical protein BJ878DRAFT_484137 [Calycina marina]